MRIPAGAEGAFVAALPAGLRQRAEYVLPWLFSYLRMRRVLDVRAVTPAHLHAFAQRLARRRSPSGESLSDWTVYAYLSLVRRFFAFLVTRGVLLYDPAEELNVRTPQRLSRSVPSEARVRRLVSSAVLKLPLELRDRAMLEVLYGTGIRRGECLRMDLAHVDLRGGTLFVKDGKGKKDRVVPLVGRANQALSEYLRDGREALAKKAKGSTDGALFLSCTGTRLGWNGVRFAIERYQRASARGELEGAKLSAHLLRHACATHLLAGGADIRHVQVLLGHSQIETTALYTRVDVSDLRRAIEDAHPLGVRRGRRRPGRARASGLRRLRRVR